MRLRRFWEVQLAMATGVLELLSTSCRIWTPLLTLLAPIGNLCGGTWHLGLRSCGDAWRQIRCSEMHMKHEGERSCPARDAGGIWRSEAVSDGASRLHSRLSTPGAKVMSAPRSVLCSGMHVPCLTDREGQGSLAKVDDLPQRLSIQSPTQLHGTAGGGSGGETSVQYPKP